MTKTYNLRFDWGIGAIVQERKYPNIGVGQEWQNTIPEGLTSIHLTLGE